MKLKIWELFKASADFPFQGFLKVLKKIKNFENFQKSYELWKLLGNFHTWESFSVSFKLKKA